MNFEIDSMPHFVGKNSNFGHNSAPQFVPVFCKLIPNYSFTNPDKFLNMNFFFNYNGQDINFILEHYCDNLKEANLKIDLLSFESPKITERTSERDENFEISQLREENKVFKLQIALLNKNFEKITKEIQDVNSILKTIINNQNFHSSNEFIVSFS